MEKFKLSNILPLGLILPFVFIILTEYLLSNGLVFYNQKLNQKINDLEKTLANREEKLLAKLEADNFFYIFSKVVNVLEIAKNKRSLNFIIMRFNQLMPKFLNIKNFEFDSEKNQIKFKAAVRDWQDYVRFHNYLTKLPYFKIVDIQSPKLEQNEINFSMVIFLTSSFFQL